MSIMFVMKHCMIFYFYFFWFFSFIWLIKNALIEISTINELICTTRFFIKIFFFWYENDIFLIFLYNFQWWFRLGWRRRIGSPSEVRRFGADGSIFGRNSDPLAKAEAKNFETPIRFNLIRQYASLIGLKRIGSDSIFHFLSDRIGFIFIFCRIGR